MLTLPHIRFMFNRMTTKRIAAVALAASAIIAQAPATAEGFNQDRGFKSTVIAAKKAKAVKAKKAKIVKAKAFKAPVVKKQVIKAKAFKAPAVKKQVIKAKAIKAASFNRGFKAKTFKAGFGYSPFFVAKLKKQALSVCSAQLRHDAYKFGYKGAQLTGAKVKHIGKDKFVVHAGAKLYDGYSFGHEAYNCTVVHGKVIDAYKPKKLKF